MIYYRNTSTALRFQQKTPQSSNYDNAGINHSSPSRISYSWKHRDAEKSTVTQIVPTGSYKVWKRIFTTRHATTSPNICTSIATVTRYENNHDRRTNGTLYTYDDLRKSKRDNDDKKNNNCRNNGNKNSTEHTRVRTTPLLAVKNELGTNYAHNNQQHTNNRRHNNQGQPIHNSRTNYGRSSYSKSQQYRSNNPQLCNPNQQQKYRKNIPNTQPQPGNPEQR